MAHISALHYLLGDNAVVAMYADISHQDFSSEKVPIGLGPSPALALLVEQLETSLSLSLGLFPKLDSEWFELDMLIT